MWHSCHGVGSLSYGLDPQAGSSPEAVTCVTKLEGRRQRARVSGNDSVTLLLATTGVHGHGHLVENPQNCML